MTVDFKVEQRYNEKQVGGSDATVFWRAASVFVRAALLPSMLRVSSSRPSRQVVVRVRGSKAAVIYCELFFADRKEDVLSFTCDTTPFSAEASEPAFIPAVCTFLEK